MKSIKDNLQFIILCVAIGISWGTLMTRVEYIIDQQKEMNIEHVEVNLKLEQYLITQIKQEARITLLEELTPNLSGVQNRGGE